MHILAQVVIATKLLDKFYPIPFETNTSLDRNHATYFKVLEF